MPDLFEVVPSTQDGTDHLASPESPYYVIANEGTFLYRATQIGTLLLKQKDPPASLGKLGYKDGVFNWTGEKIPRHIFEQATDFFRRIYGKHGTEAEVLITMHNDTKEFRLFVPLQRINGSGVKSIYEPSHIDRNYTIVGTIHSHCHFSAFHSGTDSNDASDMDGVHLTIGMLQNEPPEIVAMVAMNGVEFHYKDPRDIADLNFTGATAPDWWDQYVYPGETQSDKPKTLKSLTQEQWNEFRGLTLHKPKVEYGKWQNQHTNWRPQSPRTLIPYDRAAWDWRAGVYGGAKRPIQSSSWTPPAYESYGIWDEDGAYIGYNTPLTNDMPTDPIEDAIDIAEEGGIFRPDEWGNVPHGDLDNQDYWIDLFTYKLKTAMAALTALGVTGPPQKGKK